MKAQILNKIVLLTLYVAMTLSAFAQTGNNLQAAQNQTSGGAAQQKSSAVRVGLAGVKTGAVGDGMNAQELSGAIGNLIGEYLKGSNVELVPLEAKLAQNIDAEAKSKNCQYVLYAQVSHKKGGGGGFGKMFASVAPMLSMVVPMAGVAGAVLGSVASTAAMSAAGAMSNVKPKDEITLEYKLVAPGSQTPAIANTLKGKAKSSGEDIITPLVEQTATAIMNALSAGK